MTILLDTHLLLWWLADSPNLPVSARRQIADRANVVLVSSATAWEIAIKRAAGKLTAPDDLESAMQSAGFEVLPISIRHALAAGALPRHHDDPFDRMLVAQAQLASAKLLTCDRRLAAYGDSVSLV